MESIKTLNSVVTGSVTDALTQSSDSTALSAEDYVIILGLVLCLLFGFVLSFFILSRIKRR